MRDGGRRHYFSGQHARFLPSAAAICRAPRISPIPCIIWGIYAVITTGLPLMPPLPQVSALFRFLWDFASRGCRFIEHASLLAFKAMTALLPH